MYIIYLMLNDSFVQFSFTHSLNFPYRRFDYDEMGHSINVMSIYNKRSLCICSFICLELNLIVFLIT